MYICRGLIDFGVVYCTWNTIKLSTRLWLSDYNKVEEVLKI